MALPPGEAQGGGGTQGCSRKEGTSEGAPEAVRQAVGGGYCRLQMPLKPALALRETRLGAGWALWKRGGGYLPPFQCIPGFTPFPSCFQAIRPPAIPLLLRPAEAPPPPHPHLVVAAVPGPAHPPWLPLYHLTTTNHQQIGHCYLCRSPVETPSSLFPFPRDPPPRSQDHSSCGTAGGKGPLKGVRGGPHVLSPSSKLASAPSQSARLCVLKHVFPIVDPLSDPNDHFPGISGVYRNRPGPPTLPPLRKHGRGPKNPSKTAGQRPPRAQTSPCLPKGEGGHGPKTPFLSPMIRDRFGRRMLSTPPPRPM